MVPEVRRMHGRAASGLFRDSLLVKRVQLLIGSLQRLAMADAENDDGIAAVFAIQLVVAAGPQHAVRFP